MNTSEPTEEVTPDDLLSDFRSSSFPSIVIFTIVVHAVLLFGTSIPYLWRTFAGADTSTLTEEQRTEKAMKAATESLRKIASEHGLKPQDLSSQLGTGGGTSETGESDPVESESGPGWPGGKEDPDVPIADPADPEDPKNAIEKELEVKTTGPSVPPVPDDDDDLFK